MKYLFEYIPPVRSDILGMLDAASRTNAYALINDSADYHFGSEYGGKEAAWDMSFTVSKLRDNDVASGADEPVLRRAERIAEERPEFFLIGEGPAASMTGVDTEDLCAKIEAATGINTAYVAVNGHHAYDTGVSKTLEALVKHDATACEKRHGTMCILGGSLFDLGNGNMSAIRSWCEAQGYEILNKSPENNFARAGEAEINLVITLSGLPAAQELERRFGTPYVTGLPFGSIGAERLRGALRGAAHDDIIPTPDGKRALIFAEPYIGCAIRDTLRAEYGFGEVTLAAFQNMACAKTTPQDKKLRREKDVFALLSEHEYDYIIGDALFRACWDGRGTWIELPYKAFYLPSAEMPVMVGTALNEWLDAMIKG